MWFRILSVKGQAEMTYEVYAIAPGCEAEWVRHDRMCFNDGEHGVAMQMADGPYTLIRWVEGRKRPRKKVEAKVKQSKYLVQTCSPKATVRIQAYDWGEVVGEGLTGKAIYPFELMRIGLCFTVPFDDVGEQVLRNRVSCENKRSGKRFVVIKHGEFQCYEVSRIA